MELKKILTLITIDMNSDDLQNIRRQESIFYNVISQYFRFDNTCVSFDFPGICLKVCFLRRGQSNNEFNYDNSTGSVDT